ncbi:sugar phosphate isomerase/epimerase family protein [Dictyobacter kobayashii]|uniref:Myo-inositol catabolism protein IolH n=1 Tax=Dictyobacter kobayashii TaxID=2014872 RepID=A0A402AAS5_9CHLR|nr:sugar phosphate isomerase/epimerase family protein [Dictyobacter kobayashii]GCE16257.1 myo-inositol catabolism protein IolH [Dictyobacter kobayashii]
MTANDSQLEKIAVFPKCFMDDLCITRRLSLFEWIEMASSLGVDGLELYPGFFTSLEPEYLSDIRSALRKHQLAMPMLCASPDFTQPDPAKRKAEIEKHKRMIELVDFFAAAAPRTCRVLSGQRRPEISEEQGIEMVVDSINQLLPYAQEHGVILAIENHYKDNYWIYPEFAQHLTVFAHIVQAIDSPWFGVNYDPSNALLAGEDPLQVLDAVKERVVSMHASDRRLQPGYTIEDLRAEEDGPGYASILSHGEIGTGLNDFATIFQVLKAAGFHGWISIEDGVNGLAELQRSVDFLRKILSKKN